jgi:hypothetical protein
VSWDEEDTGLPPAIGHSPPCLHPALHILLTRGSFGEGESHLEKDSKVIYLTQLFLLYFTILKGLSHEIDFKNVDENGLNKGRGWFLNFSEAPMIFS